MMPTAERVCLIAEVLAFVRAAQRLPGITRIALIGSLTTNKADPKDADLLVSVTDLTSLARLTRKLQGHAQNSNRGGEAFLADPHYASSSILPGKCVMTILNPPGYAFSSSRL